MKKSSLSWKSVFSLPFVPSLIIVLLAAAVQIYHFSKEIYSGWSYLLSDVFATYALVLVCTGYARLIKRDSRWAKPFTLPMLPTMLIIIAGAALLIYVFTAGNFGPIAYVAYLLSAYALVLAIVGYIRLFREMSQSRRQVSIEGRRRSIAVKSRFLNGLLSTFLAPFVEAVFTYFSYTMVKTAKGVQQGSIGTILLALLSVVGIMLLSVAGPLFFLVGVCCVYIWMRPVRGIVLCAIGLVLMVLVSQLTLYIMRKQREEMAEDLRGFRY